MVGMENKHNAGDLAQMQSLPLQLKIRMTERRVKEWYDAFQGNVYISLSGGKDSLVLADIVKRMYPDVPRVYIRTGLEHQAVDMSARNNADVILRPKKSFVQVITEYGYPVISKEVSLKIKEARSCPNGYASKSFNGQRYGRYDMSKYKYLLDAPFRISHRCCDWLKKSPAHEYERETKRRAYLGVRCEESQLRKTDWYKYGCNAFKKQRQVSQPLSFWTEQDILMYIYENRLELPEIYGKIECVDVNTTNTVENSTFFVPEKCSLHTTGASRSGCAYCMYGIAYDNQRFLRLKKSEPKVYDFIMRGGKFEGKFWVPYNGLGYKFIIDYLNEYGNMQIKY